MAKCHCDGPKSHFDGPKSHFDGPESHFDAVSGTVTRQLSILSYRQLDVHLNPELEPNYASLSGNIPGADESGTACNADGTLMTAPANNYVFAEPAIPAGLSTNSRRCAAPIASALVKYHPVARAGPSHQHKAKRGPGRQPLDLNWEIYDDEGNAISAREFAVQYPEEWEERFANTYDHLL
ncbi:hypothetical protein GGX14DRAFT_403340 [Mycena pura]|uniref:Uncharacterized protein n=1 Tax=Mycena pura TaxID=153505 RepID=A0AAD6UW81_9AGAR|nr:hypothetical protein GGX14DRAFT_403340 [Mycena pura]